MVGSLVLSVVLRVVGPDHARSAPAPGTEGEAARPYADRVRPSQRALAVEPFYAMEFGKRAAALEAQGHPVVRLNLGEPDFGAPPAVLSALEKLADSARRYTVEAARSSPAKIPPAS